MKDTAVQKELFKEFEMPKKKKGRMSYNILPKNYILFNLSYEQIIFITIAAIMVMVLIFSLGVERGKGLIFSEIEIEVDEVQPEAAVIAEVKEAETVEPPAAESIQPAIEEKRAASSKLFTIQVIAYRSKKSAQKELVRLSKKGYDPFIIVGGNYYQICVGEYKDKKEAEGDSSELRKTYRDSFIRKR